MISGKKFWSEIQRMRRGADRAEQIRPLTAKDYETLYEHVRDLHGPREASVFAQLCVMMQDNSAQSVAQALCDLKEHDWQIGKVFTVQAHKIHAARRACLGASDYFGYLSRHDGQAYPGCAYTRARPLSGYDGERAAFLAAHFSELMPEQKSSLRTLLRGASLR